MILYFADRQMNILGQASTSLPEGFTISDDKKLEDIETGVATFSCYIGFEKDSQLKCEELTEVGNYLLRSDGNEKEFYTIIDTDIDTKSQEINIYAEDAGLDLINEVVGDFEAAIEQPAEWYINQFAADSGFEIGINEIEGLTRRLVWNSEQTVTERLAEIANEFGGCEISYSFEIEGMKITHKYINIYKQRGKDNPEQLRLNREIDRIRTSKTISNLATALEVTGGTPDDAETPITLKGFSYDDGDFFVDGTKLKSRNAVEKWSRYISEGKSSEYAGHIVKPFYSEATTQAELCAEAVAYLKEICDIEINFEIDLTRLPDNVAIGDRINIVDDAGELYVSTRILKLEKSVANNSHIATLGEHLIKTSGIAQKVKDLAAQFAKQTISVQRAKTIANNAKEIAEAAQTQAETAAGEAAAAVAKADEAKGVADTAAQSANNAQAEAKAAQAAVDKVEKSVTSLESTVINAKTAADNAQAAAETATAKAEETTTAATNAQAKAEAAETAAGNAQTAAESATSKANEAIGTANEAKTEAEAAIATAIAAKIDGEQAEKDIADFVKNLETVENTMKADYARKTDLTEAAANLQTQISRNAGEIKSTASKLTVIDETVNDAADRVTAAQNAAILAQEQADEASAAATVAQNAADNAQAAAIAAQNEADIAKTAAEMAQNVLDQARADLRAAKIDLETVKARADVTEAEIAEAQAAVDAAQATVTTAQASADEAIEIAEAAQETANVAVDTATEAQAIADKAAYEAELAQLTAESAKGNADEVKAIADEAAALAEAAQETANNAKANADSAQSTADDAKKTANSAQATANEAAQMLNEANITLNAANERLTEVLANANATEAEIAEAQAAVETAQAAADEAATNAENAQASADTARNDADTAQAAADEAKAAANEAQQAAQEARTLADKAQGIVAGLVKRITNAETNITQTADRFASSVKEVQTEISENATKIAKAETLIQQLADSISLLVRNGENGTLIKQDSNGLYYFDISGIEDIYSSIANNLDELSGLVLDAEGKIDVLKSTVDALTARTEYIKSYTNENDQPCLELGEGDSSFKVYITNTEIKFADGTSIPAYISNKKLMIENTVVKEELQFGDDAAEDISGVWIWKRRKNGNLGLMWKGGLNNGST